MGEHERWMVQPSGLLPNGLLSNESTPVVCVLNAERWSSAEERTAELIACIQPNQPSEERRNAVADYVQRLIMKCFPCQVFTFGSVPLKTYLPDGDIDLTAFSNNPNLKDTWATLVRDILESEEKSENAEFRVKEVQYIQAEVKIIKCLVENIVVDISFNRLGGLCTLCFLEEVDHLINQNHLFKRSIILIKAWCYYESRILGANHGLISTYALETLVLYIFHVFNNSFGGPLEVLYRFLEFFSNFDWDNFCVSLWGPVPISSLPDVTPEPPRKDSGELLLTKGFLEKCNAAYAVFPTDQENQGQPFVSKHFNVIDPLRVNNNLGRSVSKGNFFRIRSAFAFGAKRLARLLDCPKEDIVFELNLFFMNTWERHGSGNRPDAPTRDLQHLMHSNTDHLELLDNHMSISSSKKMDETSSTHESVVEGSNSACTHSVQHPNYPLESTAAKNDVSSVSHEQIQKGYANQNISRLSDPSEKGGSNQGTQAGRSQRNLKLENSVNEYIQGRYLFARTRSSPELTDTYTDISSRARHNKAAESVKNQVASANTDSSRRKNGGSESISTQSTASSADEPPIRHISPHQNVDIAIDSNGLPNNYVEDSGPGNISEERASVVGAQGMLQEEQDLVNMMSSSVNNFSGQAPMPLNLTSTHLPLPFSPSMLASIGYAQRNLAGLMPGNIPLVDPSWASNLQFAHGLVPYPLGQYFPGMGSSSNSEDLVEQVNDYDSAEMAPDDADNEFWHERDESSNGRFGPDDGNLEWLNSDDDRQPSTSGSSGFVQSSQFGGSSRHHQKHTKENRGSMRDEHHDKHPDDRINNIYPDDRVGNTRFSSAAQASSLRSKSSSEGSWNGSSSKVSKITREKRGRKSTASATPSTVHGKGKTVSEHASVEVENDNGDWNAANMGTELAERSSASHPGSDLYHSRLSGFEAAQTSGSESFIPMNPMLLGPGYRQRGADGSGALPFAFYPTGPPVPFVTMLPFYNFPSDASSSDSLTTHPGREEGLNIMGSSQNFESSDGLDDSEALNAAISTGRASTAEPSEEPKDILNSDFLSHWQNLQYGRSCQNPRVVYPSPVLVPPGYLQGRFPWDGPGRPLGTNVNMFPQMTSYVPRIVPISSVQSVSDRPAGAYQRYVDDLPRYRAGTGTYLPNPKPSIRDRHSSGTRRSNYNYDRNDHHGEREEHWNTSSKSRAAGRSHHRNQVDKSSSRLDRLSSNESRAERPWNTHRHESLRSYQSQNGPLRPNSSQSSSANVAYGMYPLPGMNPNGVTSNGPQVPSVVMFYPYDNSSSFGGSPGEPLEFGSLGPMGFMGSNEMSQHVEGARGRGTVEEQRFHGSSQRSSPDQPSSPHLQRRV